MAAELKLEFGLDKETKNARRFKEDTTRERGLVGTIYVLKEGLEEIDNPETLEVIIRAKQD